MWPSYVLYIIFTIIFCRHLLSKFNISIFHKKQWFLIDPLGELDKVYRDAYIQNYNDFMVNVKRFCDEHKKDCFEVSRNELNSNEEQQKSVYDKRITEWNAYKVRCTNYTNWLIK